MEPKRNPKYSCIIIMHVHVTLPARSYRTQTRKHGASPSLTYRALLPVHSL